MSLRSGVASLADLDTSTLPLAAACREARATLPPAPAAARDEDTLASWRELAQTPKRKAQRLLSKRLDEKHYSLLLESLDPPGAARLRSCGGPLAAGWQLASPGNPAELLEDRDYETTARALLGQDLAPSDCSTCRNRRRTGPRSGTLCGAPLCPKANHSYLCAVGGGFVARSVALERTWARIHRECGFAVDDQVHEPAWDRWVWHCTAAGCDARGTAWAHPAGPCERCGAPLNTRLETAILDLEVRSAEVPKLYLDVTVRHAVGTDQARLQRAAQQEGATNAEAESDKHERYPPQRSPYPALPLALETYGRHGRAALRHLRKLARAQAARLENEGDGEAAAGLLVARWGRWLSVALHRANARGLRAALGGETARRARGEQLAADLAD